MTDRPATAPREERSYLAFTASALAFALGAGLFLGLLIPTAAAAGWHLDESAVIDAHGTVQVAGWLGLYVAGMALQGAGLAVVGGALAWSLHRSRGRAESWRPLLWAASAWWAIWAALAITAGVQAAARGGSPPPGSQETLFWTALLGAIGNLTWAVQARSVPIFFGRGAPRRLWLPGLAVSLGTLLVVVAEAASFLPFLRPLGLGVAGAGTIWLAALVGAVKGTPHRLRPPSRPAARFLLAANRWAVLAGVCLVAGAVLFPRFPGPSGYLDQAALHLLGLGLATTLIVGMTRLLAPVFAIRRALNSGTDRLLPALWRALVVATSARFAGALLQGLLPEAIVQALRV